LRVEGRRAILAVNGEIYNTSRLQQERRVSSGSEAVLRLFEELGSLAVRRLDGTFALAVTSGERFFLARDPLGVMPLYYADYTPPGSSTGLVFASELKALIELDVIPREFPPGTCYDSEHGFVPYYVPPAPGPRPMRATTARYLVRATLEESIVKRLACGAPVGVLLSGGVEDSTLAAVAGHHLQPLHTFAVSTREDPDLGAARDLAHRIGSIHHEYVLDAQEVRADLPKILFHLESFDQRLVRDSIRWYYGARLASKHVGTLLTGEGAGQLLGDHRYHQDISDGAQLHRELRRSVTGLHHRDLQRLDRMTMAHGVEVGLPFLDVEFVQTALGIPPELKIRHDTAGHAVDQWILRHAFEDSLPPGIVWPRTEGGAKERGMRDLLTEALSLADDQPRLVEYARRNPRDRLRSPEEAFYHRTLVDLFGKRAGALLDNVAR
jgi:asparagine synthase (glutamine-hydrolysing)